MLSRSSAIAGSVVLTSAAVEGAADERIEPAIARRQEAAQRLEPLLQVFGLVGTQPRRLLRLTRRQLLVACLLCDSRRSRDEGHDGGSGDRESCDVRDEY